MIIVTAGVVEDLAILGAEGGPPATTSDPGSGTAAKGPSSTGAAAGKGYCGEESSSPAVRWFEEEAEAWC